MADDIRKLLDAEEQVDQQIDQPASPAAPSEPAKSHVENKPASEPTAPEPQPVAAEVEKDDASAPETETDETATKKSPSGISEKGAGGKKLAGHVVLGQTDDPRARWYVVHTYSGHEARVAENLKQRVQTQGLEGQVFEMFIPTQDKIEIRGGKKYSVTEKIFPGYILVRMILNDPTWLTVRTTPGVTGFVGTGSKPLPLSDVEVATIQRYAQIGAPKYKAKFSVGEAVRITDGPFADYLGSIGSIDEERGRIKVLVSIFGRETPVELDFLQVTKI